jgi:hypothetical protein
VKSGCQEEEIWGKYIVDDISPQKVSIFRPLLGPLELWVKILRFQAWKRCVTIGSDLLRGGCVSRDMSDALNRQRVEHQGTRGPGPKKCISPSSSGTILSRGILLMIVALRLP